MRIALAQERCKGCEICVDVCKNGLLRLAPVLNQQGHRVVFIEDTAACTGCGLCALMCPDMAIEVYGDE